MIPALFHISFNPALPNTLHPKLPAGFKDANDPKNPIKTSVFREDLPPRICFAPSVEHCFRSIYPNVSKYFEKLKYPYMIFHVYVLVECDEKTLLDNEEISKKVWDGWFTKEHAFTGSVKVKRIAKIRVMNFFNESRDLQLIKPYQEENYPTSSAVPDNLKIEVLRVYDDKYPLILNAI